MAPEQDRARPEAGSATGAAGLGRLWTALLVASAAIIAFALHRTLSRS